MMSLQVVFAKKSEKYWENCSLTCRIFETDIEMQDKNAKSPMFIYNHRVLLMQKLNLYLIKTSKYEKNKRK